MFSIFCHLHHITQNCANLNNTDQNFLDFTNKHIFYNDDDYEHLPIPVYSVIKPSIGPYFILNASLSLGRFSTTRKMLLNDTLRGWFLDEELICEEDDPEYLQNYSNEVISIVDNKHIVYLQIFNVWLMLLWSKLEIYWIT